MKKIAFIIMATTGFIFAAQAETLRDITLGNDFVVTDDDVTKGITLEMAHTCYADSYISEWGYFLFKKREGTSYYDLCRYSYVLFDPASLAYSAFSWDNSVTIYGWIGQQRNSSGVYEPAKMMSAVCEIHRFGAGTYMLVWSNPNYYCSWANRWLGYYGGSQGSATVFYRYYKLAIGEAVIDEAALNSRLETISNTIVAAEEARAAGDAALATQLQTLATQMETNDEALRTALAAEQEARTAGDGDLADKYAAQADALETANENLAQLSSDLAAETAARESAMDSVNNKIDAVSNNLDALNNKVNQSTTSTSYPISSSKKSLDVGLEATGSDTSAPASTRDLRTSDTTALDDVVTNRSAR